MDRQMDIGIDGWRSSCDVMNPADLLPYWALEAQKDRGRWGGLMVSHMPSCLKGRADCCLCVLSPTLSLVCGHADGRCLQRRRPS